MEEIKQRRACRFDHLLHTGDLVDREIVHNNDIAALECWSKTLLQIERPLSGEPPRPRRTASGPDAPTARITPSPLYLRINATSSFKSCSGGVGFLYAEAEG